MALESDGRPDALVAFLATIGLAFGLEGDAPSSDEPFARLRRAAKAAPRGKESLAQELCNSFASLIERPGAVARLLAPIRPAVVAVVPAADATSLAAPKSTLRLLLALPGLQTPLLEKLLAWQARQNAQSDRVQFGALLAHLRWLERVDDPDALADAVLALLQALPPALRDDLVAVLPEIVPDVAQHRVLSWLSDQLLRRDTSGTLAIVQVVGKLSLTAAQFSSVQLQLCQSLPAYTLAQLPGVLSVLFAATAAGTVEQASKVAAALLDQLQLEPLLQDAADSPDAASHGALVLDALQSGLAQRGRLADALLVELERRAVASPRENLRVLDLLVLWSLSSVHRAQRRRTDRVLAVYAGRHALRGATVQETLRAFAPTGRELAQQAVAAAAALLQANDVCFGPGVATALHSGHSRGGNATANAACTLYERAFVALADSGDHAGCSLVVHSLVAHIGSGQPAQVNSALVSLGTLAAKAPAQLAPYAFYLKTLLDSLASLAPRQVFLLFSALNQLGARGADGADSPLAGELRIVETKLLRSADPAAVRHGIMAGLALLATPQTDLKVAEDTLARLCAVCEERPEHAVLFLDELAQLVAQCPVGLVEHVRDWATERFLATYCCSRADAAALDPPAAVLCGLNDDEEDLVVLVEPSDAPAAALCPLFRLVARCALRLGDERLEAVDAVLGGPWALSADRQEHPLALIRLTNWIRELLTVFGPLAADEALAPRIGARAAHLVATVAQLDSAFSRHGSVDMTDSPDDARRRTGSASGTSSAVAVAPPDDDAASVVDTASVATAPNAARRAKTSRSRVGTLRDAERFFRSIGFEALRALICEQAVQDPGAKRMLVGDAYAQLRRFFIPSAAVPCESVDWDLGRMRPTKVVQAALQIVQKVASELLEPDHGAFLALLAAVPLSEPLLAQMLLHLSSDETTSSGSPDVNLVRYAGRVADALDAASTAALALPLVMSVCALAEQPALPVTEDNGGRALAEKLSSLVQKCMEGRWPDWSAHLTAEKSVAPTLAALQYRYAERPLEIVAEYADRLFPALAAGDADTLETRPAVTGTTLVPFFCAAFSELCASLVRLASGFEESAEPLLQVPPAEVSVGGSAVPLEQLFTGQAVSNRWTHNYDRDTPALSTLAEQTRLFSALVAVARDFEQQPRVLAACMRLGRKFVDVFRQSVLSAVLRPGLSAARGRDTAAALQRIIKPLQAGTRLLQSLCGHSKASRDARLTAQVPNLRKSLESMIYDVKLLLQEAHCLDALWVGNLKHKSLQGEIVASQFPAEAPEDPEPIVAEPLGAVSAVGAPDGDDDDAAAASQALDAEDALAASAGDLGLPGDAVLSDAGSIGSGEDAENNLSVRGGSKRPASTADEPSPKRQGLFPASQRGEY